jgi:hypothetical protein
MTADSPMTWADAYEIAFHAMGTDGKGRAKTHRANDDPLAAHCLAEWILTKAHGTKDFSEVKVA